MRQARRRTSCSARPRPRPTALRQETDDYVDAKLANFEITLDTHHRGGRRGRERLAGRSALDALTADEADEDQLPEHLDG